MAQPLAIQGRLASLADAIIESGEITIDAIQTNNSVLAAGEVTGVSQNTETTIVTVPANGIRYITKIICTGEENAKWNVYLNSVWKMTKRTTDRTVDFDFSTPLKVGASTVIDVKAIHHGPDSNSDFQATVLGYTVVV
jgi:hypothetical protein